MSNSKGYYGGDFGGRGNPLEDRHLESSAETAEATPRIVLVSDSEIKKLKAEGKGILQRHLYKNPVAVGETLILQGEQETLKVQVTEIPDGINDNKNKRTAIEVKII